MRTLMETDQKTVTAMIAKCNVMMGSIKSLKTPMGMLLRIEVLIVFTAILLLFLVTFGSWRCHCNSKMFRLIIFVAYTLSTYLLTYTLGLMHDAPSRNELFPIWATFLMIILGSANSISAYSLEDKEQWKRYNWQFMIKSIWLFLLIDSYFCSKSNSVAIATWCLYCVLFLKSDERARALMAASQHSLERNSKVVADYMREQHENGGEVDPVSMRGYTYLVRGEEERPRTPFFIQDCIKRCLEKKEAGPAPDYRMTLDKGNLTTVEKVWECQGRLLSSRGGDLDNKIKDKCLSFALFKLLRLRYASYGLPQKAHENTWKLIHNELPSQEEGHERAFRVIEVELTFLFYFFYTKYGVIFQSDAVIIKLAELIYIIVGIWATTSLLKHYKRPNSNCQVATMPNGLSVNVLVTSVMLVSFIIVELMQFFLMGFSGWAKVMWICKYVQKESWQEIVWIRRIIKGICWVQFQKPWERKLRQYSFLESYSHKPFWLLNNAFMAAYIDQTRDGQKQSTPIPLPEEVKRAVFLALKLNYSTKLENGLASLRVNNVSEMLSWACWLETQAQVKLVWHIATSFCDHKQPVRKSASLETRRNFRVATSLSKYLTHLVAFAPRLLPNHPYITEYVFDQAIMEAKEFFLGCKGMEDQVDKMEGIGSSAHEKTIIRRGAQLGNRFMLSCFLLIHLILCV